MNRHWWRDVIDGMRFHVRDDADIWCVAAAILAAAVWLVSIVAGR